MLFFDGGMGTLLQAEGLQSGELPETWNIKEKDKVTKIHRAYFEAGSDIVLANTFGANALKFHDEKMELEDVISAAIANVRDAAKLGITDGREYYVALDVGPTGKLLKPSGDLSFDEAYEAFAEAMQIGEKAGADLIHIETMSDTYEVKAAVLAAKENTELPVFATMIFDEKGKLLTGADVPSVVALLERTSGRCVRNQLWNGTKTNDSNLKGDTRVYIPSNHCKTKCRPSKAKRRRDIL